MTDTAEIYKGATFKFPSVAKDESITQRKKGTAICYGAESPKMALRNLVVAKIHDKNCWTIAQSGP